ncbi:serine/threonine-protein kinase [Actinomadura hibisca]|uniref:serine/threonine-protein kinase n=1 Tax=Actinomadura hibisca TaxID=68565 RepID=UPI001FE1D3FF|nr:serine/threonine-protein kinase [Actinomadura hibisca]
MPVFEPLQVGDPPEIGGYRVLARLGAGGMGRVYLAATQAGRRLAIKVVRPDFADDPEFRRRFRQEIAAAQRVQSLYTAPVIDADPDGPRPWLATAHVPGPSLAQAVADLGPLPEASVRVLFAGIAEALQAVHGAGVVHRDLKPSNVLLAEDGPRVIDFGISRAADSTPLTRTGMRIGSPQFMAPEQALGHSSTPAIDVFALGSVAFYAATGRTPFGDGPDSAVLFRIAHEEPNLDGCPDGLRPLVARCLAKDPADRPAPREVLDELSGTGNLPEPAWLPDDITRVLPAYKAAPPPPQDGRTGDGAPAPGPATPPGTGPGMPYRTHQPGVPSRSHPGAPPSPPSRGPLLLAIGGGVLALLVLVVVLVSAFPDDGKPVNQRGTGTSQSPTAQSPTAQSPAARQPEPTPSAPETSAGSSGPPSGGTIPVGGQIAKYKRINISDGYGLAFGNDPEHPKESFTSSDGADLSYSTEILWGNRFSVLDPGQAGTYEACRDNTRYARSLGSEYLVKGKLICATSSSGLIGLVKVLGRGDEPDDYLTIELTVWQGVPPTPGD